MTDAQPQLRARWRSRGRLGLLAAITLVLVFVSAALAARDSGLLPGLGDESDNAEIIARVEVTALPTATVLPSPTPAPPIVAPTVDLRPAEVGQGETSLVWVHQPGADSGSVAFLGQRLPLTRHGDVLWAVVGAGLAAPLGASTATITTRDARGGVLSTVEAPFSVVTVERPVDYLIASEEVTAVLTPEAAELEAFLRTFEQYNVFDSRPRWSGFLVQPAEGIITTEFGQGRSINGGPVGGFHSGTDIANVLGTPVRSAAAGRVAWAGEMPIRGNTVLVDHGAGVMTGYSHLESIEVALGDAVDTDTIVGLMGSTGFSTGSHLHWELTIYGVNVDPMTWTLREFTP